MHLKQSQAQPSGDYQTVIVRDFETRAPVKAWTLVRGGWYMDADLPRFNN